VTTAKNDEEKMHDDPCVQDDSKKTASELSMDNVGGVFVVLMAGMGLGTLNHHSTKANHFSKGNHL
jgi:hypothetical protein